LPNNQVSSIAIDQNDTKWIGTAELDVEGGLVEFDGTSWIIYNTSNSGLPSDYINTIAIDKFGTKWIGTHWGLTEFDGTNWITYNTSNSGLPYSVVWSITIDENGTKWIGTDSGGLAEFDGTNWTTYNHSNSSLPRDYVNSVAIDENGTKWIGTGGGGLGVYNENGIPVYVKEIVSSVSRVNIFPNPTSDKLNIELLDNVNISNIEIINIQGSLIKSQSITNNQHTIDVSDLSAGIYFCVFKTNEGTQTLKLIKH